MPESQQKPVTASEHAQLYIFAVELVTLRLMEGHSQSILEGSVRFHLLLLIKSIYTRARMLEPILAADLMGILDIQISVSGGGIAGQSLAIHHGA